MNLTLSLAQSTTTFDLDDCSAYEQLNDIATDDTEIPQHNPLTMTSSITTPPVTPPGHFEGDSEEKEFEFIDNLPTTSLFEIANQSEERHIMAQKGYKILHKICDTLQGELYKAQCINTESTELSPQYVAIKKVSKQLVHEKVAIDEDGMTLCVAENIIKEAVLLKHLTVANTPMGSYIVQYIDFFQTKDSYYLVTEYIDGMNLKQFIQIASQYVANGSLELKKYQKVIKYVHWQIAVTLYFLHKLYHCCHLDLNLENIMLKDLKFTENKDGSISLPTCISIKLCDFGVAEIFDINKSDQPFLCHKQDLSVDNHLYHAPNVVDGDYYDARAVDMWSLGMIFYQCLTMQPLYQPEDMWTNSENGYWALMHNQLKSYVKKMNLTPFFAKDSFKLLSELLNLNEMQRISTTKCIQHSYFKVYLRKYAEKIGKKIRRDSKRLKKQFSQMNNFPFYSE